MRGPAATFTAAEKEANFRIYIIPGQLARLALGVLARTAVNAPDGGRHYQFCRVAGLDWRLTTGSGLCRRPGGVVDR